MNQIEMQTKIENLVKDEDYMKKLLSLDSAEAISKELEKEDIELSPDELKKIYTIILKKENGELSDAELEEVAGGLDPVSALVILIVAGAATITGLCIAHERGCL